MPKFKSNPLGGSVYNASAIGYDADGKAVVTSIVEIDGDGFVLRCAGHWSPFSGTRTFDGIFYAGRPSFVARTEIVRDGGAAYKSRLAGLALPPAYRAV